MHGFRPRFQHRRTTDILRRLLAEHQGPRLSLEDLAVALGARGAGMMILLLALPNAIPGPAIPGLSALFGLPMAVLSLMLLRGAGRLRLPSWLGARSVAFADFRNFLARGLPWLERFEHRVEPRPSFLTCSDQGERIVGVLLILLSLVLALPVPGGNLPAALAIILIAFGLIEDDGRVVTLGAVAGILAMLWNFAIILTGAWLIELARRWGAGMLCGVFGC